MPILKAAIETVGSLDNDKLRVVLDSGRTFETMIGPARFGGEQIYGAKRQVLYEAFIGQIRDCKTVIVDRIRLEDMFRNWGLWPEEVFQ